jgi:5'-3' exonuclease
MKRWLVLDVHYLCHRAFHSTQNLHYKEKSSGVVFGFLKSITHLKDEFQTDNIVFCFEHPHLFRRDVYPQYKRKRATVERTDEERVSYESLVIQISELRKRYLPRIGFKNIFSFRGMESDDIMAEIADTYKEEAEIILVTADNDMLQCLDDNVTIWNPATRKLKTAPWFEKEYGMDARKWAIVKAIAGCSSDEVEGIKGVGEKTAVKYLLGMLPVKSKAFQSIVSSQGKAMVRRNRALVRLPYEGCPTPTLIEDEVNRAGWRDVCGLLGMRSIASHPPIATRNRK